MLNDKNTTSTPSDIDLWLRVRKDFQLAPDRIHLASFWLSSHPRLVRNSIDYFRDLLDRDPLSTVQELDEQLSNECRIALGRFCQTQPSQIALTNSTTDGICSVLTAFKICTGDELLMTEHEHYASQVTMQAISASSGAKLTRLRLYDPFDPQFSAQSVMTIIQNAITPKTRLLFLTWVHSSSGIRLPIDEIGSLVKKINQSRSECDKVLLVVDATHCVGVLPINLHQSQIDVLIASCHKWMLGPRGTGFISLRAEIANRFQPSVPSFCLSVLYPRMNISKYKDPTIGELFSTGGFCAFEHRWSIPSCVNFLEGIGMSKITSRIIALNRYLKRKLTENADIKLITPMADSDSAGITCFTLLRRSNDDTALLLKRNGLTIGLSPYKERFMRLSPGIYNSEDEIDKAIRILTQTLKSPPSNSGGT